MATEQNSHALVRYDRYAFNAFTIKERERERVCVYLFLVYVSSLVFRLPIFLLDTNRLFLWTCMFCLSLLLAFTVLFSIRQGDEDGEEREHGDIRLVSTKNILTLSPPPPSSPLIHPLAHFCVYSAYDKRMKRKKSHKTSMSNKTTYRSYCGQNATSLNSFKSVA
jgi:hypothetical protein